MYNYNDVNDPYLPYRPKDYPPQPELVGQQPLETAKVPEEDGILRSYDEVLDWPSDYFPENLSDPSEFMMSYPEYHPEYQKSNEESHELSPIHDPIASVKASSKAPRKKYNLLPLLALCLCFTLIGGALGGYAVMNFFSPPAAEATDTLSPDAQSKDVQSAANPAASPDVGSDARQSGAQTIVYQPGAALTPKEIFEMCNQGVVAISTETASRNVFGMPSTQAAAGSGFIISEDGYIVTNNHVIENATTIKVMLADGDTYSAELIGRDVSNDLAVLKIEAQDLTALSWNDLATLSVGDPIVAIGNPLGELANSMTSGIVSALDRDVNIDGTPMTMLQIDASVSPGNSGGPLLDSYGQVIGIVSAKSSGNGVEGIGFAIPSTIARGIVEQLIQHGYVTGRPQLGINVQTVDESTARYYNLPVGVYVTSVDPGSCAEGAGLQTGDVIVEFNGAAVSSREDLVARKNASSAGDSVTVKIIRAGNEMTLTVILDEAQPEELQPQQQPGNVPPWMQNQNEET